VLDVVVALGVAERRISGTSLPHLCILKEIPQHGTGV
jgi:hypothetical protein